MNRSNGPLTRQTRFDHRLARQRLVNFFALPVSLLIPFTSSSGPPSRLKLPRLWRASGSRAGGRSDQVWRRATARASTGFKRRTQHASRDNKGGQFSTCALFQVTRDDLQITCGLCFHEKGGLRHKTRTCCALLGIQRIPTS